jgi:hypothetical protein
MLVAIGMAAAVACWRLLDCSWLLGGKKGRAAAPQRRLIPLLHTGEVRGGD